MDTPELAADALLRASGAMQQALPERALFVVATPIGNAADITLRALWVLSRVDAIAAEDTRTTSVLLRRYGIGTPTFAAHMHNEQAVAARIVERLGRGERIALVTDAGTPAISDPGTRLVRAVREAGLAVVPVPGASALAAAACAAGLHGDTLTFAGFLPARPRERARRLAGLASRGEAFVLFEAPHRIVATGQALAAALEPQRQVVMARELTKKFETISACTAADLPQAIGNEPRGEYVLLVDAAPRPPADGAEPEAEIDAVTRRWLAALAEALPASRAAAVAARASGLPRERLYELLRK